LLLAGLFYCKLTRKSIVGLVTDVPGYSISDEHNMKFTRKMYRKIHLYLISKCDNFVFLTKNMNNVVNIKKKPYCVVEGFADIEMLNFNNLLSMKSKKKIILYAGTINVENGIDRLVSAFVELDLPNTELHFYGDGPYVDELNLYIAKTKSIKYFGSRDNSEILEKEMQADLLINPRPTDYEFTKYSFPSKLLEYMVSGTPVLTTKLPGLGNEYNKYVYFIEDETINGIKKALNSVVTLSKEVLYEKGKTCKEFVLRDKNNLTQVDKILNMLKFN
jgi:glycosyltransferase involved in cell wall biosynthesis